MDLMKLNGNQMAIYQNSIKKFMKENNLDCFGSTCVAVEQFPEIDNLLLTGIEINKLNFSEDIYRKLKIKAKELENKLKERFETFFKRCVRDNTVKSYMKDMIYNIKTYSQAILSKTDEKYSQFCEEALYDLEEKNLELFTQELGEFGQILRNLIDESYQVSYS